MLGNRTGWVIALLILLAEAAGLYYALSLDRHAPPTSLTNDATLARITLPPAPTLPLSASRDEDAVVLYRQAIALYIERASAVERMIRDSDRAGLSELPAIDLLVRAADARGERIFATTPDALLVYGESTDLQAVARLGHAAYRLGALQGKRPADRDRALTLYRAAFILGRRLAEERLTWREYDAGVGLMSAGGAALAAELAKSPDTAEQAAALQSHLDTLRSSYKQHLQIFEALYTFNESKIAAHAGDVFAFAERSEEPMWRTEAILKLGRMRYNIGVPPLPGNQRQAHRLLKRFANADEPLVRRAAEVASSLTVEQFRTLR